MHRLAHLSDLHFGSHPAAQARIFDGLVRTLAGRDVDLLVFTGDLFDTSEPDASLVEGFARLYQRLEGALGRPTPALFLPGNHDRRGDGVFAPWRDELFARLRERFADRPELRVLGGQTPFLAERVTPPGFPCDLVAYDSTWLPQGFVSAGGVIRQEDLLEVGAELAGGDAERPLLFLLHHHLIPTPVTDVARIETRGRPALQQLLVGQVLPRLVANGDREELTMTALGAGSALTTLQALGRAVLVLHGHKHYATARHLSGLGADADLLVASAGSAGLTQGWSTGEFDEAPSLWPSFNLVELDGPELRVTAHAWSPRDPERRSSPRVLAHVRRDGTRWRPVAPAPPEAFEPVLLENAAHCVLTPSQAQLGRLDVATRREVRSAPSAWLDAYWEVVEGAPGALLRDERVGDTAGRDRPCPARVKVHKDGVTTWRVEGALFASLAEARAAGRETQAYEGVTLLNRARAAQARLSVDLGPVKTRPFATLTDLTTGRARPWPLTVEAGVATVRQDACPARTLLRISWPLERT